MVAGLGRHCSTSPAPDLDPELREERLQVVAALKLKVAEAELDLGRLVPESPAGRGNEDIQVLGEI